MGKGGEERRGGGGGEEGERRKSHFPDRWAVVSSFGVVGKAVAAAAEVGEGGKEGTTH